MPKFLPLALTLPLALQAAPRESAPQGPQPKPAAKAKAADPGAEAARRALVEVLDSVNAGWFGAPYQGVTAVKMQGTLGINLSGAAVNAKVDQLSQGQVKGNSKGGNVSLKLNSVYFANGDYRTEMGGDFGDLLGQRRGDKGFLYSKQNNIYTTRVDPAEANPPKTYLAWFRSTLNDIKAVYVDSPLFTPSVAGEEQAGGRTLQHLVFNAPTKDWDPKKREQNMADTLGFWKRGRLEVAVDKTTKLPYRLDFLNKEQGVQTRMDFSYDAKGHVQTITIANQSRGMEGPGFLRLSYGGDGLITNLSGELTSGPKKVSFDLALSWSKDLQASALAAMPPAGATKVGREDLETRLLVGLAGQIMDLQRNGLNLRSVTLAGK
ncbi:MAG TPA: hypothetical protein VJ570_05895 [Holophagaceae bacterium]|nr:hypothetical protein [Holophagaceae bacterium]